MEARDHRNSLWSEMSSDDSRNRVAAGASEDAQVLYDRGLILHARGDREALDGAERCWRRAAASGHLDAQYNLGVLCDARGTEESSTEARRWWGRAADAGHADAQYILGVQHHERNEHREAERWWCRAAASGHLDSLYNVGVYRFQRGQQASARRCWVTAADAGHADALYALGAMVHHTEGTAGRDRAAGYWRRAAAAGHVVARRVLDDLSRLSARKAN